MGNVKRTCTAVAAMGDCIAMERILTTPRNVERVIAAPRYQEEECEMPRQGGGSGRLRTPGRQAMPKPKSGKDIWDKIATLTVPFVTLTIGLLGAYATYSYNQADLRQKAAQADASLRQQKAQADADREQRIRQDASTRLVSETQALERLFEFVASSDAQKRQFGYAMFAAMGKGELAASLIGLKGDQAGAGILRNLAKSDDAIVSATATRNLAVLENVTSAGSVTLNSRSSCRKFAEEGFRTNRITASAADYQAIATQTGIEPEALAAFVKVETAVNATLPDGRPRILFERHIFRRFTKGMYDQDHPDISNAQPGGYGAPGAHQYERLVAAAALNCPAALAATSWGAFHIMGFMYARAGYKNVDEFVKDVLDSGPKELGAAMVSLRNAGIIELLKNKDWERLAFRYNGPVAAAAGKYPERLRRAYADELSKRIDAP